MRVREAEAAGGELAGTILAELKDYGNALQALDQARVGFSVNGSFAAAQRVLFRTLGVLIHDVGNLKQASVQLDRCRGQPRRGRHPELRTHVRLLRAHLLRRQGDAQAARAVIDELIARASDDGSPLLRAEVAHRGAGDPPGAGSGERGRGPAPR